MVSSLIFQKFSGEGLTEPPPQTPPPAFSRLRPRFGLRPQFSGASRPRLGLRPRYSGASRPQFGLRPQLSIGDLGLAPPKINSWIRPCRRFCWVDGSGKFYHTNMIAVVCCISRSILISFPASPDCPYMPRSCTKSRPFSKEVMRQTVSFSQNEMTCLSVEVEPSKSSHNPRFNDDSRHPDGFADVTNPSSHGEQRMPCSQ